MTRSRNPDSDSRKKPFLKYLVTTGKTMALVLLLAAFVHVSWNMFAPDVFGLDAIRMKQALGLVLFAGVFAVIFRFGTHKFTPDRNHSA